MKDGGAKEFRMAAGYELLMIMERNDELPLPNIHRLSQVIDEYYTNEGFKDIATREGYGWESSPEYWRTHISDVSEYMRKKHKQYFGFKREDGEFTGVWKFMNKGEWEKTLKRNNQDISTRVENQNEKIEDTLLKWNTNIPKIAEVPRITN